MNDFRGQTALVTGGGRCIGFATAARLAKAGANVATLDLEPNAPPACLALAGDVALRESLECAVRAVLNTYGTLDVLVCAHGIFGSWVATVDVLDDPWNQALRIDALGTLASIQTVLPHMFARQYGRIITIASFAEETGQNGDASAASGAAVISMTRAISRDVAARGVLVNCVVPPMSHPDAPAALWPNRHQTAALRLNLPRPNHAEEAAAVIALLASDDISYSTGACFDLSGGGGHSSYG